MKRLRLFDFRCPLFWLVIFFRRQWGEPWIELNIYGIPKTSLLRWGFKVWRREDEPEQYECIAQPRAQLHVEELPER
jgi:hypothetical protein